MMLPTQPATPQPAHWWQPGKNGRVRCNLCPRYCSIPPGSRGFCTVRENHKGQLISTAYGHSTGFATDPIEKKPLYHFYPGSSVLSFGTIGCNLGCKFCQNWHISKARNHHFEKHNFTPREIVENAQRAHAVGIAFTYNDPTIFAEWVVDIAREAHKAGLKNVLVTNGYITAEARPDLFRDIDAVNVDLKSFRETFYRTLTLSHLDPVLDTLRWLVHQTEIWVEITNLVIPDYNDSEQEIYDLTAFIAQDLHPAVPLHFSAFYPDFKLQNVSPTPVAILRRARNQAMRNGCQHVYIGNVWTDLGQETTCAHCGEPLITRRYYQIWTQHFKNGKCQSCGTPLPGHFGVSVPEEIS